MSKTGTAPRFGSNGTWVDLTGWSALTNNHYSGSSVDADVALVCPNNWNNALLTAHVPYIGGATSTGLSQIRVVRVSDGAVLGTSLARTGSQNKCYVNIPNMNISAGEKFKIQGTWNEAGNGPYPKIVNNSISTAGAYVSIEQQVVEQLDPALWDIYSPLNGTGTLNIVNGNVNGEIVTPSVPLTYGVYKTKAASNDYKVSLVLAGQVENYHSSVSCVARMDDSRTRWVEFAVTKTIFGLYWWNGTTYASITAGVSTQALLDLLVWGATVELSCIGTAYRGYVNGTLIMSGTLADTSVPITNKNVGFMMQDDSRESGDGTVTDAGSPTPRIASWGLTEF